MSDYNTDCVYIGVLIIWKLSVLVWENMLENFRRLEWEGGKIPPKENKTKKDRKEKERKKERKKKREWKSKKTPKNGRKKEQEI